MNKDRYFKGVGKVFNFTLKSTIKEKSFFITFIVISVLVFFLAFGSNFLIAKKTTKKVDVEKIYVLNKNDDLRNVNIDVIKTLSKEYKNLEIVYLDDMDIKDAELKVTVDKKNALLTVFEKNKDDDEYVIKVKYFKEGKLKNSDATRVGNDIERVFDYVKYNNMEGITDAQFMSLAMPVVVKSGIIDETEKNIKESSEILKFLFPMCIGFILYFMLIFYGQTICKNIVSEKASKLMEYMLTNVSAVALVSGKILALTFCSIIEFITWIVCIIFGFRFGNNVAKSVIGDFKNPLYEAIDGLKGFGVLDAFSAKRIILATLIVCLGFLFFCVIAGLFGSFIGKPEEISSVVGLFNILIMLGFFSMYFGILLEKNELIEYGKYIPFCSPFILPGNIIFGDDSAWQNILATLILIISTIILMIITGKVYEMRVFLKGSGLFNKFKKKK